MTLFFTKDLLNKTLGSNNVWEMNRESVEKALIEFNQFIKNEFIFDRQTFSTFISQACFVGKRQKRLFCEVFFEFFNLVLTHVYFKRPDKYNQILHKINKSIIGISNYNSVSLKIDKIDLKRVETAFPYHKEIYTFLIEKDESRDKKKINFN